jgi:peptidyl-prolyl cis-trans isomerase B (cyclophilin B)
MKNTLKILVALFMALALFGCTGAPAQANATNQSGTNATATAIQNFSGGISMQKNPTVVFETTKGTFKAEIYSKEAPITAGNFLNLVNSGFYNGLTFHRYEPGFVIQGGDPKGDGTGGSGKTIPLEIVPGLTHELGALSMARTNDPNSATSQFFVVIGEAHFLDGQYAVFGKVTEGMDVALKIRKGDRMNKVYVQQ